MGTPVGYQTGIHPARQAATERLRRTVQSDCTVRMVVPISLGRSGSGPTRSDAMDVVLQSRTPKYGLGRYHPQTAAGHGCVTFLLLAIAKNGGFTILSMRYDSMASVVSSMLLTRPSRLRSPHKYTSWII